MGGLVVGAILGLVSFPVLWTNEGRAVNTARGLKEGASAVVSVSADQVDPANEGKLVHVGGLVTTDGVLEDPLFGVSQPVLLLERGVEMYQWKEISQTATASETGSSSSSGSGEGSSSKTTYVYEKVWSNQLIPSASFKEPAGHSNPGEMPVAAKQWLSQDAMLGAFRFPTGLIGRLPGAEDLIITNNDYRYEESQPYTLRNGVLYLGAAPDEPAIGDVRVSWKILRPGEASVIARQVRDSFEPFTTKAGTRIEMVEPGILSAEFMFAGAEAANKALTWGLRVGGFFLMFFGILMIFKPLSSVARMIPLVGRLVDSGLTLFAGIMAGFVSLIVIAVAWFAYRPILSVSLLAIAIALVFGVRFVAGKKQETPPPLVG